MTRFSDIAVAFQVQLASEEPEPYDLSALLDRRLASMKLRAAMLEKARRDLRNVRNEVQS